MPAFCSTSHADALDLASHLLWHVGEINPYAPDLRQLDLAGVVEIVRERYGDEAARHVRVLVH